MNFDSFITFLGWAALTYSLIHVNFFFADVAGQAINQARKNYNNTIREEVFQELADKIQNSPRTNLKP